MSWVGCRLTAQPYLFTYQVRGRGQGRVGCCRARWGLVAAEGQQDCLQPRKGMLDNRWHVFLSAAGQGSYPTGHALPCPLPPPPLSLPGADAGGPACAAAVRHQAGAAAGAAAQLSMVRCRESAAGSCGIVWRMAGVLWAASVVLWHKNHTSTDTAATAVFRLQGYTQYGGLRPFGVSLLYAGW